MTQKRFGSDIFVVKIIKNKAEQHQKYKKNVHAIVVAQLEEVRFLHL